MGAGGDMGVGVGELSGGWDYDKEGDLKCFGGPTDDIQRIHPTPPPALDGAVLRGA